MSASAWVWIFGGIGAGIVLVLIVVSRFNEDAPDNRRRAELEALRESMNRKDGHD